MTRLFHFSEQAGIEHFEPLPVRAPSPRPQGQEWLNGPLVWAIEEDRQPMYLFPRECPRILLWPTPQTTAADLASWWGARDCRMIAHIEWAWLDRLMTGVLWRYEFCVDGFEPLHDAGMWVSRDAQRPVRVDRIGNLPAALREAGVELRVMPSLAPLHGVWASSLHASGIRLRNAVGWEAPSAPAAAVPRS